MAKVIDALAYNLVVATPPSGTGAYYAVAGAQRLGIPVDGRPLAEAVNVPFADQKPGTPVYSKLVYSVGDGAGANLQEGYFIETLSQLIAKINA
jgi:hypothetical protein